MSNIIEAPQRGRNLTSAQRLVVISKLIDILSESYYSTNELAKMTGLSRQTVDKYRMIADEAIGKMKLDRNVIRNLQIKRTYLIIEKLMLDLKTCANIKEKTLIYNQIAKFSQHLALITGLNVETHVNVDQQQLVIVRADNNKRPVISETQNMDAKEKDIEVVTIKDTPDKQSSGHSIK